MNIKYYFSGFDKETGFKENLAKYLKQDIIDRNSLIFVPSDFSELINTKKVASAFTNHFKNIDINFDKVITLNKNMSKKEMYDFILNAGVVYLLGGNPSIQLKLINDYELKKAIKNTKAVIMGMSAGAMCMSKYSLLLPVSEEFPKMDIRKGMNLSGISIYPHYNSNGEVPEVLDCFGEQTKKSDLLYAYNNYGSFYLLSDNSEIREQNDNLTFIGDKIIYVANGKFEIISH